MSDPVKKADELKAAITALESQRSTLGDSVIESAVAALRQQLQQLLAPGSEAHEQRKLVTIVFVDVSGFTALAEKLDAEEVRALINACFDDLVPIVQSYGGTIDKFIGDEIMALFGAPIAHENDPERALRSALEMMQKISGFNETHGTALGLHIGVNTGSVVAGAIGSHDRKDYSVMGDAVNLAARLEDASVDGEIYVGPDTHRLTASLFDFEEIPALQLKGKSKPVRVYRLIGLKIAPKPVRGIEGLRCEMVGRDREIDEMEKAVRGLREGAGGIVAIAGDAGVGKSRLIAEALNRAGDLCRVEGRALSHTTGMSYWMARDILRALVGSPENTSPFEVTRLLRRSLEMVSPDSFEELFPYLATLLQLPLEGEAQERVKFLSTEALQRRILRAFKEYVSARANQERLILFWEDLHWCDPSSLLVLEAILPLTKEVPLLLVLAYRPNEGPTETLPHQARASCGEKFHLIQLSPLTREQSGSLVDRLLRIDNFPRAVRELILDRSEGNPFFVEEMLRSLLDSGAITLQDGRVVVTAEIATVGIPETVEGVLTARMDRLSSDERNTLQSAAVIGREFSQELLEHISPAGAPGTLSECLAELQRRDFIRLAEDGQSTNGDYIFKHAITHDVAYHALLRARRKELHGRVGEGLERLFPDRLTELLPTLAYHFERAEAREKAFQYSKEAAAHAQAVFANTEAVTFYRSAIRQAGVLLEKRKDADLIGSLARVHEALGDVLQLAGENEEARKTFKESLALLPVGEQVGRSRLYRKTGHTDTVQRHYAAMAEAFDAADKELGETEIEPETEWWHEKIQILLERMHLLYWQGMSNEMMQIALSHRADVEKNGTPMQRGKFFQMLALSQLTGARYVASDEAVRLAELAVSTSQGSTDLSEAPHVRFVAGLVNLFRGNLKVAIGHYEGSLSLAQRVGDLIVQARCLTYLTVAHRRSGHTTETRSLAERTLALADQLGMVEYVAMARANLAWLAWREHRFADTKSLGREALNLWHEMEDPYGVDWQALLPLIAVATEEGNLTEAIELARGLFAETQHPLPEALTRVAKEAIAASKTPKPMEMRSKLKQVIETAKEIGYL